MLVVCIFSEPIRLKRHKKRAFDAGRFAYPNDASEYSNPYTDEPQRSEWARGWAAAKKRRIAYEELIALEDESNYRRKQISKWMKFEASHNRFFDRCELIVGGILCLLICLLLIWSILAVSLDNDNPLRNIMWDTMASVFGWFLLFMLGVMSRRSLQVIVWKVIFGLVGPSYGHVPELTSDNK
jgi:ribosome modulation factor